VAVSESEQREQRPICCRSAAFAVPSVGMTLRAISGFQLRRAVLGTLLAADGPMAVSDIVAALRAAGVTTLPHLAKPPHGIIANLLDYQESTGRVVRTGRAVYVIDPAGMSRSTRWRYVHWQRLTGLD
jgi:hypothetical protein